MLGKHVRQLLQTFGVAILAAGVGVSVMFLYDKSNALKVATDENKTKDRTISEKERTFSETASSFSVLVTLYHT